MSHLTSVPTKPTTNKATTATTMTTNVSTTKRHWMMQATIRAITHTVIVTLVASPIFGSLNAAAQQVTTTSFQYDPNGNLTQITDPLGHITQQTYDPLNRVQQQIQPAPAAGVAAPVVNYAYDGQDQLVQVTDPRNNNTRYTVDGIGNTTVLTSPDTSVTTNTYDAAGNLKTSTDARAQKTTYTYDVLNRVSKISYTTGTASIFTYDGAANAKGKLTQITDEAGTTTFTYDASGHIINQTQTISAKVFAQNASYGTTGNAKGKIISRSYPSGNQLNYSYDSAGRLSSITLNPTNSNGVGTNTGNTINLLTNISYNPFGAPIAWTWGNATAYAKTTDIDGRVTSYPMGNGLANGTVRSLSYDAASRITATSHTGNGTGVNAPANYDQAYGYDNLDRLTNANTTGSNTLNHSFQYDANGNRTVASFGGAGYTDTIAPNSNRLSQTSGPAPAKTNNYDAAGHLLSDGTISYTYSARGRLKTATNPTGSTNTVTYYTNAFGQRVKKSGPSTIVTTGSNYYVYDLSGHTIGEYNSTAKPLEETVYLGNTPVAVLTQTVTGVAPNQVTTTNINYVFADHIDTPRVITRATDNKIVWRWDNADPFGMIQPNANPSGLGTFTYNLRLPGQVFDKETNLHYNYMRDYDPQLGRYVESDPIGLEGGMNTYAYVGGNPTKFSDLFGLSPTIINWNGQVWIKPNAARIKELLCQGAKNGGYVPRGNTRDMSVVYAEHFFFQYQNVQNSRNSRGQVSGEMYAFWWWAPFFYEPTKAMPGLDLFNDADTSPPTAEGIIWAQRGANDALDKSMNDLRKQYCECQKQ